MLIRSVCSFALGSLFMYGLKLWTLRMEHAATLSGTASGLGTGLLLATFIDVATDGFIIGAGFAAGGETGTILAWFKSGRLAANIPAAWRSNYWR
jgi:ZIP family zinc transporter